METKILMLKGEKGDPGGSTWGNITGTLSSQTDLKTALDAKAATSELGAAAFSNSYNDLDDRPTLKTVATTGSYNDLTNKPAFADVALTGSYDDLSGRPTQITDLTGVLPVVRGGTGAITESEIKNNLNMYRSFVLWEGSFSGEGVNTLTDSISNYKKIRVEGSWSIYDTFYGEFVVNSSNIYFSLTGAAIGAGGMYIFHKRMNFYGNIVNVILNKGAKISPSIAETSSNFDLKKIYGYKY